MSRFLSRIDPLLQSGAVLLLMLFVNGCALCHQDSPDTISARLPGPNGKQKFTYQCTLGAHRGDSVSHLENTLAAISSARQNPKYNFIEFDVQYSADKRPVVFHDANLLRLFGHIASIKDTSYQELCRLSSNQIPTYEQAIESAGGKPVNVEIKSQGNPDEDRQLIDYIIADLKKRHIEEQTLISSISDEAIKYVKQRYPEMSTGQIFWVKASTYLPFDFLTKSLYKEIEDSKADYIMLHSVNELNLKDLIRLKPKDKTIVFWNFGDTMYLVHKDISDQLWTKSRQRLLFNPEHYSASVSPPSDLLRRRTMIPN